MIFKLKPQRAALLAAFSIPSLMSCGAAMADPATDARIEALEQQVKLLTTKLQIGRAHV